MNAPAWKRRLLKGSETRTKQDIAKPNDCNASYWKKTTLIIVLINRVNKTVGKIGGSLVWNELGYKANSLLACFIIEYGRLGNIKSI